MIELRYEQMISKTPAQLRRAIMVIALATIIWKIYCRVVANNHALLNAGFYFGLASSECSFFRTQNIIDLVQGTVFKNIG